MKSKHEREINMKKKLSKLIKKLARTPFGAVLKVLIEVLGMIEALFMNAIWFLTGKKKQLVKKSRMFVKTLHLSINHSNVRRWQNAFIKAYNHTIQE